MQHTSFESHGLVDRPRLLTLIGSPRAGDLARLTLLIAPAGFGKTTLVQQWIQTMAGHPVVVMHVCMRSNSLAVEHNSGISSVFRAYIDGLVEDVQSRSGAANLTALHEAIIATDCPCVIVIDDFDLMPLAARERLIHELLLRPNSSANLRVIALGRVRISFPLGILDVQGQVTRVFSDELACTSGELRDIAVGAGLWLTGDDHIDELQQRTNGWPIAIRLVSMGIAAGNDPGIRRALDEFTFSEILGSLGSDTRRLVIAAHDLPFINRELWQELGALVSADVEPYGEVMSLVPTMRVERELLRGVSVIPVLGESLQRLAQASSFVRFRQQALDVATKWYFENNLEEDAVRLAVKSDRWEPMMSYLIPFCRELAIRDQHAELISIISPIPTSRLIQWDSDLLFWYLLSLLSTGKVAIAQPLYQHAGAIWRDSSNPLFRGRLAILDTLAYIFSGQRVLAVKAARQGLELLPDDAHHERMRAAASITVLSDHLGLRDESLRMFSVARDARDHLPRDQRWWSTFVSPSQADRLAMSGNLASAYDLYTHQLLTFSRKFSLDNSVLLMRLALIDLERNETAKANERLAELPPMLPESFWRLEIYLTQVKIFHALGEHENATDLLYRVIREADEDESEVEGRRPRVLLSQIWLDRGELDLAQAWADQEPQDVDAWPRSFGQLLPGIVMAQLLIAREQWDDAHRVLDHLIAEGERRDQQAPLVRAYSLKALAFGKVRQVKDCHHAIRRAMHYGGPSGFQRSFLVKGFDTRNLMASPERTVLLAADPSQVDAGFPILLSERECDVLYLVAEGLSNGTIADRLFVSSYTVKNHLARIYRKLSVRNRKEAVLAARMLGLLDS